MIICLCHGVSDGMVRAIIDQGARNFREVQTRCGVGQSCGQCIAVVEELLGQSAGISSELTCAKRGVLRTGNGVRHGQKCRQKRSD